MSDDIVKFVITYPLSSRDVTPRTRSMSGKLTCRVEHGVLTIIKKGEIILAYGIGEWASVEKLDWCDEHNRYDCAMGH